MEQSSLMHRFRWLLSAVATLMLVIAAAVWYSSTTADAAGHNKPAAQPKSGWHVIFSDDFNGNSLSGAKWNYEDVGSPRNGETEWYTPGNVHVKGGHLTLVTTNQAYHGQPYNSAAVDTYEKFAFTYGKIEIRAKLPTMGRGIWPALWMAGTECDPLASAGGGSNGQNVQGPWPTNGCNELDILEAVQDPTTIFMTPHWGVPGGPDLGYPAHQCTYSGGVDYSAGYHTYTMTWQPGGKIEWFIDGHSRCQVAAPGFFISPMYLIMNTAINSQQTAPPAVFPQQFNIDYVRVYQR